MNLQTALLREIDDLNRKINDRLESVRKLDERPRQMYNDTIDPSLPNMYVLSWHELTEEERNEWRKTASVQG